MPERVSVAVENAEYEAFPASSSAEEAGATGKRADYLSHLIIVPANTSPGAVSIADGSGSAMTLFAGGADSVASLHPFTLYLGMKSTGGAWKITTGADVSVIAVGNFT